MQNWMPAAHFTAYRIENPPQWVEEINGELMALQSRHRRIVNRRFSPPLCRRYRKICIGILPSD
jgi:hypothetical protein